MKGPIERFKDFAKLNVKKGRKGPKRGGKKRNPAGSTFRDYRGVDGAVNDAQKGKK